LWNASDGSQRRQYAIGAGRTIQRVQFYPNGTRFWSWEKAGDETILVFWATDRANPLWTSNVKNFTDFVPDNLTYAFRSNDSSTQVTIWDAANSTEQPLRSLDATKFGVPTGKGFSSQAGIALVAFLKQDENRTQLVLWNYTNNSADPIFSLQGVDRSEAIAFNSTGTITAVGFGKSIVLYDMVNQRELRHLNAHTDTVSYLEFSPDSRYLFSRSRNGNTRLWDITGGDSAEVARIVAKTQNNEVSYPGLSPDGSEVYAGLRFSVFGWSVADVRQNNNRVETGDQIISMAYSPLKPYALSVLSKTSILWDMSVKPNAARIRVYGSENDNNSGAAAFTYDGNYVVIDGNDLALRDLQTNGRTVVYDKSSVAGDSQILSLSTSPDGKYLVGVSGKSYQPQETPDPDEAAQNIIVWDLMTGQVVRTFGADQHSRRINQVTVSPNSRLVISSSNDGTLIVWDIETGALLSRLAGHRGPVNAAVFTPDSRYAISASDDTSLILWDLQTGQLLRNFNGHIAPIKYLAISQDGKTFVSSTGDDTIIVWQFESVENTITWAVQNRYVRQLTCDEGRQFNLTGSCDTTTNLITGIGGNRSGSGD
ncbi:MAG TPA: WD40 repeat domain-containing protein, partial [Phototrophicaceae bacterium]|nr:WD40 repeat domain-containing protein [Phototrophicaceae bacterium]